MMAKIKLALLAWEHKETILAAVAFVLFIPVLIFGTLPGVLLAKVPMVPDLLLQTYQQVAGDLKAPDGSHVAGLAWQQLLVIDAVRNQQDFSRVTEASIRALAQRFIKRVEREKQVCETKAGKEECRKEVTVTYELHPPDAVMTALAFTADQVDQATAMLAGAGGMMPAPGAPGNPGAPGTPAPVTGDCSGWQPSPVGRYFWPTGGTLTSCFGPREDPVNGGQGFHTGIDVANVTGTPIRAAHAGTVSKAEWYGNYGNLVVIDGQELQTYYGHLNDYAVSAGQDVRKGDVIGYMGTTGKSTGPHLHFETRPGAGAPVDPRRYFQ